MSRPWLPVSATEWIASASIDAEPVNTKAANLLSAIPRFARNAAMIARREPSCIESALAHQAAARHRFDVERSVEFLVGHQLSTTHDVTNRFPRTLRLLDDLRRGFVADVRIERGSDRRRRLGVGLQRVEIRLDACDTLVGERAARVRQQADRMHDVARHHRDEDVELEVAL